MLDGTRLISRCVVLLVAMMPASAATFVVQNFNDAGAGSLRQAIIQANTSSGADVITFSVGTGTQFFNLVSPLPAVTDPVTIDGHSQPGFSGDPLIIINGAAAGSGNGLTLTSDNNVVRGLALANFQGNGLVINASDGNDIINVFSGVRPGAGGTVVVETNAVNGVVLTNGAANNNLGGPGANEGLVLSRNGQFGLLLSNAGNGNDILNVRIGTNRAGTSDEGNAGSGIGIFNTFTTTITNSVVSGNGGRGIEGDGSSILTILNSKLGTNATGTAGIANDMGGVLIQNSGSVTITNSTISGNSAPGVKFDSTSTIDITDSRIGTNGTTDAALPNNGEGVALMDSGQVTITNSTISGNTGTGVLMNNGFSLTINNSRLGTNLAGTGAVPNGGDGARVANSSNITISNSTVSGNNANGVFLDSVNNTSITDSTVGMASGGTAPLPNDGLGVGAASGSDLTITNSTISANRASGVLVNGLDGGLLDGNFIGTNTGGSGAFPNLGNGIHLLNTQNVNVLNSVISRNDGFGVSITDNSNNNLLQGNFIGTDVSGNTALGNQFAGVRIFNGPNNNTIGGTGAGQFNVISGNQLGVEVVGANDNLITGNSIGLDGAFNNALPNAEDGVRLAGGAAGNQVRGNCISGNGRDGIRLLDPVAVGNTVSGNVIGLAGDRQTPRGNGQHGILLANGANKNLIGGTAAGSGNLIGNNSGSGIAGANNAGVGNVFLRNLVSGNNLLDIFLEGGTQNPNGTTRNDPGDTDTGPNNLLNFPVIDFAMVIGNDLHVAGFARPGSAVSLYEAPGTGFGGGVSFIGTQIEGSADDGDSGTGGYLNPFNGLDQGRDTTNRFRFVVPRGSIAPGDRLTSTATISSDGTSEFGGNTLVTGPPSQIRFATLLGDTRAGDSFNPAPQVSLFDAQGRFVPISGPSLTIGLADNPTGATLFGDLTANLNRGQATFLNVVIRRAGEGYSLQATLPQILGVGPFDTRSNLFNILPGPLDLDRSLVVVNPLVQDADGVSQTTVRITARDRFSNPIPNLPGGDFVILPQPPGQGVVTVQQPTTVTDSAGITRGFLSSDEPVTFTVQVRNVGQPLTQMPTAEFREPPDDGPVIDPSNSRIVVDPQVLPAEVGQRFMLDIFVRDERGSPIPGLSQNFFDVFVNPDAEPLVRIFEPVEPTDADGLTTAFIESLGLPVAFQVGVRVTDVLLDGRPRLAFTPPQDIDPLRTKVGLQPEQIAGDGNEQAVIQVTLRNALDQPIIGSPPDLRVLGGAGADQVDLVSLGGPSDQDGVFRIRLTSRIPGLHDLQVTVQDVPLDQVTLGVRAFADLILPAGMSFFGLPIDLNQQDIQTLTGRGPLQVVRFDPRTERYESLAGRLILPSGHGVWALAPEAQRIRFLGDLRRPGPYELPLEMGWNQMANPFFDELVWDLEAIEVRVGEQRVGTLADQELWTGTVLPYGWTYPRGRLTPLLVFDTTRPGFESLLPALPTQAGLWLKALRDGVSLVVPEPNGAASRSRARQEEGSWTVGLTASSGDSVDAGNLFGLSSSLSETLAIETPPETGAPPAAEWSFLRDGPTRLAGELRPAGPTEQVWQAGVVSRDGAAVTLSWPSFGRQAPPGWVVELRDLQSQTTVLLNTRSSYVYTPGRAGEERRFELVARLGRLARSEVINLEATPGRGGVTRIRMNLSEPGLVNVTVRGLGGQAVDTVARNLAAGRVVSLQWDGRDAHGRPVPHGVYRLEAEVLSPNGAVSRVTRILVVR